MTTVSVVSYTHSVTHVADNIMKSLKDIIRLSGLDPAEFVDDWASTSMALKTWIESQHLQKVMLEIYRPDNDKLIIRWDIDIVYNWSTDGGTFATDTEQLRYAILKSGIAPENAKYRILMSNKDGRPDVQGWSKTQTRSLDGMVQQSLGSTVEHSGLGGTTAYWRKK